MSKSGVAAVAASDTRYFPFTATYARRSLTAAAFAFVIAISGAHAAVLDPTQGLPPGVIIDPGVEHSWWGEWTGRAKPAAIRDVLERLVPELSLTDPLKFDGLSGGQTTAFTYSGEARKVFGIKYAGLFLALVFNEPKSNWTITGLEHEVSHLIGFGGDTPSPVPLPPAGFLFVTGLAGLGLLMRRRRLRVR